MFSPSPFHQGGARRGGGARGATPRLGVGSPAPRGGSRLTTPARVVSDSQRSDASMHSDGDAGMSEMSVDADLAGIPRIASGKHRAGVVFAQSEELTVTLLAQLPVEAQQVLRNADFARDAFTGEVDATSSFCLIASSGTCFVWKYSQSHVGPPTCYIFPCPNDYPHATTPFGVLVSFTNGAGNSSSREPALLLLSPGGEYRFWDSIGLGLTGGEFTDAAQLDLGSDESITSFVFAESQTYIATTSRGRLFHFTVTSSGGKFHVAHHCFTLSRPTGAIARLKFWGNQGPVYSGKYITAATVCNRTAESYDVWTCMDASLVKWSVIREGWEQFEFEEDISEALSDALNRDFPNLITDAGLDLELIDIEFDPQENIVLLTSFAAVEDDTGLDMGPRRLYAIVQMKWLGEVFEVGTIRIVPYQTISADRANIHPRLKLINNSDLYCVEFGDAVTLIAKNSEYSTCLTLKSLQDRTFGCGTIQNDASELLFMNSEVLMKLDIDMERVNDFDPETGKGTSIKSTMTQAILFGSNPKNPLLFTFPPDVDEESLISGADQLSRAVLASDIEVVRPSPDLTRQLVERKDRLRFLIGFINENGALGKMSQASRQSLATDAEKLYAAQQLWAFYCHRVNSGSSEQLLAHAIMNFMNSVGEEFHDDVLRAFFRLRASDMGNLLPFVKQATVETLAQWELSGRAADMIVNANDIVLCVLQSAWSFRDTNAGVYGLNPVMHDAWTSSEPILDLALDFFNMTAEKVVSESTAEGTRATRSRAAVVDGNPLAAQGRAQLPQLAEAVFRCFDERLSWLESASAAEKQGVENDKRNLRERFQQVRPIVLHTLLKHDLGESAFKLGEDYRDFRSLVDLCHATPPIYPPQGNIHADRIQEFVDKYKEEFTNELYDWYMEHSELRCIYAQNDAHGSYLDAYFKQKPQPTISWIHDFTKNDWRTAANTLLEQSGHASELEVKHAILSIGKLSQLAHLHSLPKEDPASRDAEVQVEAFDVGLDYVSVHENIVDDLRKPLLGSRGRLSLENQVDAVVKARASRLKSYSAFLAEFKVSVKTLLQGRVLGIEEMVDVLTLKDGFEEYSTAMELLKNDKEIPEARRQSAIRTIWRRIFIYDDWVKLQQTANVSDKQLEERYRKTALYSAIREIAQRAEIVSNPQVPTAPSSPTNPFQQTSTTQAPSDPQVDVPSPDLESLAPPSHDELASRWPGHSEDELAALATDYQKECARLQSMQPLGPVVQRVRELVALEMGQDDEMYVDGGSFS